MTTHAALIADAYLRRRGQVGAGAVEEEAREPGAGDGRDCAFAIALAGLASLTPICFVTRSPRG